MSTWIKICGITNQEDAKIAADLGANALGFVMHKKSPRRCGPVAAREMIEGIPTNVTCVGVWLDEDPAEIEIEAKFIGCKAVQNYELSVTLELCKRGLKCIPAIAPRNELPISTCCDELLDLLERENVNRLILDTSRHFTPKQRAQPHVLAWKNEFLEAIRQRVQLVLAGGLDAVNVYQVLSMYQPGGVDAASGIESAPGKKDRTTLAKFIEEVRRWDTMATSAPMGAGSYRKR